MIVAEPVSPLTAVLRLHLATNHLPMGDVVQTRIEKVLEGDVFLLCTDGLHHMVSEPRIREILESSAPEDVICDLLTQEAIDEGGRDNISVIFVQV